MNAYIVTLRLEQRPREMGLKTVTYVVEAPDSAEAARLAREAYVEEAQDAYRPRQVRSTLSTELVEPRRPVRIGEWQ